MQAATLLDEVRTASRISVLPKILDVLCRTSGMGFSVLARVTPERWIACGVQDDIPVGIAAFDELEIGTTVCQHVLQRGGAVMVDDAAGSDVFREHPVSRIFGLRSFISVPVVLPDGSFFGTLSALGRQRGTSGGSETLRSFELFADLIALHLDKEFQLESSRRELVVERRISELREQFIAVLGHDLRSPLASIRTGGWVLRRQPERAVEMAGLIEQSVGRMSGLISDVMDFAHGRLGGGIPIEPKADVMLGPVIEQIVAELHIANEGRVLVLDLAVDRPVRCDPGRIGQLLSNLLTNAIAHGSPDRPVSVQAGIRQGEFELVVANGGEPIPADTLARLFQPFVRATDTLGAAGLGLGLFIASQIAEQHGGTIDARSDERETSFLFKMPVGAESLVMS